MRHQDMMGRGREAAGDRHPSLLTLGPSDPLGTNIYLHIGRHQMLVILAGNHPSIDDLSPGERNEN